MRERRPPGPRSRAPTGGQPEARTAHAVVLALQTGAGNRATSRMPARFADAAAFSAAMNAPGAEARHAEAYRWLNGLNLPDVVRAIQRLDAARLRALEAGLASAQGVDVPRLQLGFDYLRAMRDDTDALTWFNANRDRLGVAHPADRSWLIQHLMGETTPEAWLSQPGAAGLTAQVRGRVETYLRGRYERGNSRFQAALAAAAATPTRADDPDEPAFFRTAVAAGQEELGWHPAVAHPAPHGASRILIGPVREESHAGRFTTFRARAWRLLLPDAPPRGLPESPAPSRQRTEQVVELFRPVGAPPRGLRYPSIDEVADEIARIPQEVRRLIRTVTVEPRPEPGHPETIAMDDETGDMSLFPQAVPSRGNVLRGYLEHETGHTLSFRAYGPGTSAGEWWRWRRAMEADGLHVSGYGQTSVEDDFAEAFALYVEGRDARNAAEIREQFAARFAEIERLLAADRTGVGQVRASRSR